MTAKDKAGIALLATYFVASFVIFILLHLGLIPLT